MGTKLPAYALNRASFPQMYEEILVGPLFRPWAEILLGRADFRPRARVLDIACGTGIVARLARQRVGAARVVGVDVSGPMLEVARAMDGSIEWREGDAAALPVGSEEFDAVFCQQGLQFFADRAGAAAEMRRVLASGGVLAVATWRAVDENPLFRDLQGVAERHVGAFADGRFGFPDSAALRDLLVGAGLDDVTVQTVTARTRVPGGAFLRLNTMALVGLSAAASLAEGERERLCARIEADSGDVMNSYADDDGSLAFDMSTNLATARRRAAA